MRQGFYMNTPVFKRILTAVLTCALLISCFAAVLAIPSVAADTEPVLRDDFEGYGSQLSPEDRYEIIGMSSSIGEEQLQSRFSLAAGKGLDGSNALANAVATSDQAVRNFLTTLKAEYAPQGLLKSYTLHVRTSDYWWDSHLAFVPYFVSGTDYMLLDFTADTSNGKMQFRTWTAAEGSAVTASIVSLKTEETLNFYNSAAENYDPWIRYSFSYDYAYSGDRLELVVHMDIGNQYETIEDYGVFKVFGAQESFRTGFTAAMQTSSPDYIDEISYEVETDQSLADAFTAQYGEFLAQESITVEDLALYKQVLEAYNLLPSGARELIPYVQTKLEAFRQDILASIPQDRQLGLDPEYYDFTWENVRVNSVDGNAEQSAGASVVREATFEDGLYLPVEANIHKSPIVSVPTQAVWPAKTLDRAQVSFKVETSGWWDGNPAIYPVILENLNSEFRDYIGLQYYYNTDEGMAMRGVMDSSRITADVTEHYFYQDKGIDVSGWLTLTVDYSYAEWPDKLTCVFTISDEKGASISREVTYFLNVGSLSLQNSYFRFGIGSSNNAKVYFKDLSFEFSVQEKDLAAMFIQKYETLLELPAYDAQYDAQIRAMAEDFFTNTIDTQITVYQTGELDALTTLLLSSPLGESANAFREKYGDLLDALRLSTGDVETVTQALAEYETMDALDRLLLFGAYRKLEQLAKEADIVRDEEDYSDFNHTFEDGVNPFVEVTEPTAYAENAIVSDPTDPTGENKVLKLGGKDDIFTLKYWPTYGVVESISFRMKSDQNLFTKSYIFGSYEDARNYYATAVASPLEGMNSCFSSSCVDGTNIGTQVNDIPIDIYTWLSYDIIVTDTAMNVFVTDEYGASVSWSSKYARGGAFGFGYFSSENFTGAPMYIDDLVITFSDEKGDFDINEAAENIDIYFTGNTYLGPDETISVTGNKIWETVQDEVRITRVENADKATLSDPNNPITVVEQADYSTDGKNMSQWVQTAPHNFDEGASLQAELLQRSTQAMAVTIPKVLEDGIYALQFSPKILTAQPVVVYVNRPDISFVTGDEGAVALQGGSMQIVGSNLVPTGKAEDVTVRLIDKSTGKNYNLPVTGVNESDAYSLTVAVPADLPFGDYEVYVHNGYGDNTCWSQPSEITIGTSPKDNWNLDDAHWFDVTDYGAKGDGTTNDLPAILHALQAASVEGGTVYFPAGSYRVGTTIPIPENVVLAGAGMDKTVISYSANRWQYGKTPNSLISIIGNVEIRDLTFYGTRCTNVVQLHDDNPSADFTHDASRNNVYFTNVKMLFYPSAGFITEGGGYGRPITGATQAEVYALVNEEVRSSTILALNNGISNLQLNNFHFEFDPRFISGGSALPAIMRIRGDQIQVRDSSWNGYSLIATGYGAIIEDCDMDSAALNPAGNGFYMARNYLHDATGNNRELLTTDGVPRLRNIQIQFIGGRPELMEECFGVAEEDPTIYLLPEIGGSPVDTYKDFSIAVTSAQGQGQLRTIVESGTVTITQNGKKQERTYIRVDRPFVVEPNRKSTVSISEPRDTFFFVNNDFYEGGASGSYGMMVNAVWDGNTFGRHEGQYFFANTAVIWYITLLNQRHYEPAYELGESLGSPEGWNSQVHSRKNRAMLNMQNSDSPFSSLGFTIRDCDFDGYGYIITQGQLSESISGFVMEHCTFTDRPDAPIAFTTEYNTCGSLLFRDNDFEETGGDFNTSEVPGSYAAVNAQGYKIITIINSGYSADTVLLGDVNLDGKVSLKDCTLIRFAVTQQLTLTEEQQLRADVNEDQKVQLKDASIIRYWILSGFTDTDLSDVVQNEIDASAPSYTGSTPGDSWESTGTGQGGTTTSNSSDWIDTDF